MTNINQSTPNPAPPLPSTGPTGPHVSATQYSPPAGTQGPSHKGMATAALVCSIVGILVAPPILGTIAIILGAIARRNMRTSNNPDGQGMATAGIIIGAIETAITVAVIVVAIIVAANGG